MGRIKMTILVDTREQKQLEFKHKFIKEVKTTCLNVGDYCASFSSVYDCPVAFERKSIADLYGTLSQGYERFKREIERAKESNIKLIIIVEGSITKVLNGVPYSQRTPESIVYQLFTLRARYDIETVFCKDREEMSEYITQFYIAHKKEYDDKQSILPKEIG
jgi:ERCC4-type nuclease